MRHHVFVFSFCEKLNVIISKSCLHALHALNMYE